jgi:uncharacterized membrane protein
VTAMPLPKDVALLAGIFAISGAIHLARPETYEPLMPDFVPAHREVILTSGVAELACAAGLLHPRTRRLAGLTSAVLLVAVYPGNLKMAHDARRSRSTRFKAIAYGRLPLQVPMIRTAWRAWRATPPPATTT